MANKGWFALRFTECATKSRFDCVVCGKPMWFPVSKVGKYLTCSMECANTRRSELKLLRARNCETCGQVFIPRITQINSGVGRYCSQKCNEKSHAAMNSKEAQKRAREGWKKRNEVSPIAKSGHKNHRWNGGKQAKRERDRMNGWPSQAARRAKTSKQLPNGTINKIGDLQGWKCVVCKVSIKNKYHVDHIMPLALGGEHKKENIQLLCPSCNLSKHAKHPVDFMRQRGFLL